MPTSLTAGQILALAPDPASAAAGKGLASARKWVSRGASDLAIWGECQGSAKQPYQTQIDLGEPAFKCSCPSHKFPCKHALGLFLLYEKEPAAFSQEPVPPWVAEWLAGRAKKLELAAHKQEQKTAPPFDLAAHARRASQREAKVAAGLADLETWLHDVIHDGLASAQEQSHKFWDAPAARLVDGQAPGLARLVRELGGIPSSGDGWPERLLERLGKLHLLLEGHKRIDTLPPETQADIRAAIGWTESQEELLNGPGVPDRWLVLGRCVEDVESQDGLRMQRTWLQGRTCGRSALELQFGYRNQPLDSSLVPGTDLDAELVFFPGAVPMRALVKQRGGTTTALDSAPVHAGTIAEAIGGYGSLVARNPWLDQAPIVVSDVVPVRGAGEWALRDATGSALPVARRFRRAWHVLAIGGGHPCTMFGEWDGDTFYPLSIWAGGVFHPLAPRGFE